MVGSKEESLIFAATAEAPPSLPLLLAATRPPILTETWSGMEGVKKLARSQSIKLCEKLKIPVAGRERSSSRESVVNNEGEEEDSSTPTKLPILRSFHSVSKQISEKKQTNGNKSAIQLIMVK